MKAKKFQLKNGLKVILMESHKSPVVSVQMWVKTGSADEPENLAGISHFIEHLVFKGTKSFGLGEIASHVEASGGQLNAYTSFDETVFYVTISSAFADSALKVVAEMMGHPIFDKTEIDNEREVVIEEIKRGQDSPSSRASQLMFSNAYKKHNYGRPVIGYDKVVKKVSAKQIRSYFEGRYSPANMFLVVSGSFDPKEMRKKIELNFGDFKKTKVISLMRPKESKQNQARIKVEQANFQDTIGYISWAAPDVKHKDVPALDVLALILGQGESSRLFKKLRLAKPLVNSIGSFAYTPRDPGLFAISFSGNAKNFSETVTQISEELMAIRTEQVSTEELQKALNCLGSDEIYSIETVDGIARKAGSLQLSFNDPEYFTKYIKQIYALKPADILRVAKKYLDPSKMTVSVLLEKSDNKKLINETKKICSEFIKQEKKSLKAKAIKTKEMKFQAKKLSIQSKPESREPNLVVYDLEGKMRLLVRKQSETPTVSMRVVMHGGSRTESDKQAGMTELFSRAWSSSTQDYSEEKIGHLLDFHAASVSSFAGRNTFGLNADYLSSFSGNIQNIVESILLRPDFNGNIIEREKIVLQNQIRLRSDNPGQIAMMNFMEKMFVGHPYGQDTLGTEETHKGIHTTEMQKYFTRVFSTKNNLISVVGDVDPDKMAEWANAIIKKMPHSGHIEELPSLKGLKKDESIYHSSDKEQSHIIMGYRGLSLDDSEKYALQIIQSVLAGQGGRLFVELRDKKSLAYSVSPMKMEGLGGGYFGAYIGCSPEKAKLAIEMMCTEFEKLTTDRISVDELNRAKRFIIGKHDIHLQRKSAVCNAIAFDAIYGLDPEESLRAAGRVNQVTSEQVLHVARRLFLASKITSVVGRENPF